MNLVEELEFFFSEFGVTLKNARDKLKGLDPSDWAWNLKGTLHHLYFAMVSLVLSDVKDVLELGTGLGETTAVLSKLFPTAKIYTFDVPRSDGEFSKRAWRGLKKKTDGLNRFKKNIDRENITYMNTNSFFLFSSKLPKQFGLIFVDGGHLYPVVAWDIMFAYNHLQDGGFMFMHDYSIKPIPKHSRVKDIIDYMVERIDEKVLFFPGSSNYERNKIVKIPCIRKGDLK